VLDRVGKKFAGWKTKCLSLAGWITLIQSTIEAIPAYTLQTMKLPRSICDQVDKMMRRFLWGGTTYERKPHLVQWDIVTCPKRQGGLGLRSMRQLNSACFSKLGWRLLDVEESLWTRVLTSKYERGRKALDIFQAKPGDSSLWKGIVENIHVIQQGIGMAIGDGRSTSFWHHRWATETPLIGLTQQNVPADLQSQRVRDYWDDEEGWKWDLFAHYLPVDTRKRIASFDLCPAAVTDDRLYWKASSTGLFTFL